MVVFKETAMGKESGYEGYIVICVSNTTQV